MQIESWDKLASGALSICCILCIIVIAWTIIEVLFMNKGNKSFKKNIWILCALAFLTLILVPLVPVVQYTKSLVDKKELYYLGIEQMTDASWHDAAVSFNKAGEYENAEILRDYCYYVYILEEGPEWVPYMGLNEIVEVYHENI